jgi:CheY-like chemotaxis protein
VGVQEALNLAATSHMGFDLLLSDLRLRDGNGWDLLRRLGEKGWRPQQAIAISGGNEADVAKSKSAGFRAHLVKPIAPQVLEAALIQASEVIYTN